jgi:hypothetical protein
MIYFVLGVVCHYLVGGFAVYLLTKDQYNKRGYLTRADIMGSFIIWVVFGSLIMIYVIVSVVNWEKPVVGRNPRYYDN